MIGDFREIRSFEPSSSLARQVLFFPGFDGDGTGGTGGGGGQPAIDDNTKKFVIDSINQTVNNAIANLKKTDLPKIVSESVTSAIGPLSEQLGSFNTVLEGLKTSNTGGNGGGSGSGSGGNGGGSGSTNIPPEVNAKLKTLDELVKNQGKTIETLQLQKKESDERAEKTERASKIRQALSEIPFVDGNAAETAFMIFEPQVKRNDDGTLIAGDNYPLNVYFKDAISKDHKYLLRPTGASGSGAAGSGSSSNRGNGGTNVMIDDIKTGMPSDKRAAAVEAIKSVMQAAR